MALKDSSTNVRPAQIMLSGRDDEIVTRLQSRALALGRSTAPGPTTIFRAGLSALQNTDDNNLRAALDAADERPGVDELHQEFKAWCSRVADAVTQTNRNESIYYDPSRVGHFSKGGRFVALALLQDGRVLISGLAVGNLTQASYPETQKRLQLFPDGLAHLLSMNPEGALLAANAIVAFLLDDDAETDRARDAIDKHQAKKLR